MSTPLIDIAGNLGAGLGQGLVGFQQGRIDKRKQLADEALKAFAAGDIEGAYHLARQADGIQGLMGPLSNRVGPKLEGTWSEKMVEGPHPMATVEGPRPSPGFQGPMPGTQVEQQGPAPGVMSRSYDPSKADFSNQRNIAAIGKYVGAPAPKAEYHNLPGVGIVELTPGYAGGKPTGRVAVPGVLTLNPGEQAYMGGKKVAEAPPRPTTSLFQDYDPESGTFTLRPKVPGAVGHAKPGASDTKPTAYVGGTAAYRQQIEALASKHGVDPDLVQAVMSAESGGNPTARSPVGAIGLMQLMPGTAQGLGVDPNDPLQNLEGGVMYLAQLQSQFGGDLDRIVAAYNAGPGAVGKHKGVPPFKETRAYLARVKANLLAIQKSHTKPKTALKWDANLKKYVEVGAGSTEGAPQKKPSMMDLLGGGANPATNAAIDAEIKKALAGE